MTRRTVSWAVAGIVLALALAAGIEVCTLLPFLTSSPRP